MLYPGYKVTRPSCISGPAGNCVPRSLEYWFIRSLDSIPVAAAFIERLEARKTGRAAGAQISELLLPVDDADAIGDYVIGSEADCINVLSADKETGMPGRQQHVSTASY